MFSGGALYSEELLLNDEFGNLYVYVDRIERIHESRDKIRVRSPFIRRGVVRAGEMALFTDGRKTFIYDGDLFPIEFPGGFLIDYDSLLTVCSDKRLYIGSLERRETIDIEGRITACRVFNGRPFLGVLDRSGHSYLFLPKRKKYIRLGSSIITSIERYKSHLRVTLLSGSLLNVNTRERLPITHEAVDVKRYKEYLLVLSKSISRSYLTLVDPEEAEIIYREDFPGRYYTIVSTEPIVLVGENIKYVEL